MSLSYIFMLSRTYSDILQGFNCRLIVLQSHSNVGCSLKLVVIYIS